MAKQPRENRVPIMMSEEELKAIDDWRFENRIATRSDAIRRLCFVGLAADAKAREFINEATTIVDDALAARESLRASESGSIEEFMKAADVVADKLVEIADWQADFVVKMRSALPAIYKREDKK